MTITHMDTIDIEISDRSDGENLIDILRDTRDYLSNLMARVSLSRGTYLVEAEADLILTLMTRASAAVRGESAQ
jgi:hypothetical protein